MINMNKEPPVPLTVSVTSKHTTSTKMAFALSAGILFLNSSSNVTIGAGRPQAASGLPERPVVTSTTAERGLCLSVGGLLPLHPFRFLSFRTAICPLVLLGTPGVFCVALKKQRYRLPTCRDEFGHGSGGRFRRRSRGPTRPTLRPGGRRARAARGSL